MRCCRILGICLRASTCLGIHTVAPGVPSLPFPNDARLEKVSRKTPMTEEARTVALVRVARSPKAAGFTGADLQAVVDAAQLAAIHGYLDVRVKYSLR